MSDHDDCNMCNMHDNCREMPEEFIEFDGSTCEKDCLGWDTISERCCCGNNRVCWFDDEHTRAVAY